MKIIDKMVVAFDNDGENIEVEVCIEEVRKQGGGTAVRSFSRLVRLENEWDKFVR